MITDKEATALMKARQQLMKVLSENSNLDTVPTKNYVLIIEEITRLLHVAIDAKASTYIQGYNDGMAKGKEIYNTKN